MMKLSKINRFAKPWVIFFAGVLFYCFAYFLRVYTGVLESSVVASLHITATGFGLLTSFYYFSYAPMQIPVGVAIDKIGPRRAVLAACFVASLGALIFANSSYLSSALLGRFLVGIGSAFAYVTALKLATIWLPRRYFATATGCVTALGMVAAIFTDNYLTRIMGSMSLHHALILPVYIGVIIFIVIFFLIKDKDNNRKMLKDSEEESSAVSFAQLGHYLSNIVKDRQMWLIGAVGAFLYLPSSVFLDTWAFSYLRVAHGLSAHHAAYCVSLMFLGWIISSIFSGALSDMVGNRRILLIAASLMAMIISLVIFYWPMLTFSELLMLMFLFGIGCGPHPLCFTLAKENFPIMIAGTVLAFTNFIIMMGGFIFQPIVGEILDWVRAGRLLKGAPVYTAAGYQVALAVVPIALFIALVITFFIKDTYRQ